jgi:hypothetical protein
VPSHPESELLRWSSGSSLHSLNIGGVLHGAGRKKGRRSGSRSLSRLSSISSRLARSSSVSSARRPATGDCYPACETIDLLCQLIRI